MLSARIQVNAILPQEQGVPDDQIRSALLAEFHVHMDDALKHRQHQVAGAKFRNDSTTSWHLIIASAEVAFVKAFQFERRSCRKDARQRPRPE